MDGLKCVPPLRENDYLVIDGGFSGQLGEYVPNVDEDPLWTARSLVTSPESVVKVHEDYLNSGARVILTNTYQASVAGFVEHLKVTKAEAVEAMANSVKLAQTAIKNCNKTPNYVLIGGSVGPYGACMHDGSEYTGAYLATVSREALAEWHLPRIRALTGAGVNFLAGETLPCWREAVAVLDAAKAAGACTPLWLSFTLKDASHLSSGETVESAVDQIIRHDMYTRGRVMAIGFNCCEPSLVSGAVANVRKVARHLPCIAYPNSGETWDAAGRCWRGSPTVDWCRYVGEWLKLGVVGVGGCCRITAKDIPNIRSAVITAVSASH